MQSTNLSYVVILRSYVWDGLFSTKVRAAENIALNHRFGDQAAALKRL